MYQFTIRDIENLCGIKAHTLRIWEQRYNLIAPSRKAGSQRQYDNEDLKKLLRVSILYHRGWKISKIAQLSETALTEAIHAATPAPNEYHYHMAQLIEKAIVFDKEGFVQELEQAVQAMG